MKSQFFLRLLTVLVFASSSQAALQDGAGETPLLRVLNDRNTLESAISLKAGIAGGIAALEYRTTGDAAETRTFSMSEVGTGEGVVLEEGQGVKAILLRGRLSEASGTGTFTFRFVKNGLLRKYRECEMGVQRTADGRWTAIHATTGAAVSEIRILTWKLGISTLQGICP